MRGRSSRSPERSDGARPTVDGYEIIEELGRGGMGVVYKARDLRLGRRVALRFVPDEQLSNVEWLARFQREARTASVLNHPHICTIHDLGEHEGRPFIIMELIEGRSLQAFAGQRLSLDKLATLIGQTARALAVAHAVGIVHRDIKPENVMVREDGYVKVLDFGLARDLSEIGTVAYLSPEQVRSEPASSASDVFSLGVVLYELATGQHPFDAESDEARQCAIATRQPLSPSRLNADVSARLEALIEQMLAKDPRQRPTAAEVDAALAALVGRRTGMPPRPEFAVAPPRLTVGRQRELAELRAAFAAAEAGRGLMVCVAGEPGIGKTTLVEDFLQDLGAKSWPCHLARGRCSERVASAKAYLPFLQALEGLLRSNAGNSVTRFMKAIAPTWYLQVAPAAGAPLTGPSTEVRASSQARLKRELCFLLQELSRLGPVVLFFDDVHCADASTIDLLAHVGSQCTALRLLVVVTFRLTELLLERHPFLQVKLDLQARGHCRQVQLGFLTRLDLESYLALAFPAHQFPEEFIALVHDRTEGNPLFMVDLLRYLRERGVIAPTRDRWSLVQSVPDLRQEMPESVRSMIRRKLEQLGENDRQLLAAASAQGHEFDSALVARALELEAADVEERFEVLDQVHGLVRLLREHEFPDRTLTLRYGFVHGLYQNTLSDSLPPTRRAELSLALAEALLACHSGRGEAAASELALLFEAGRDFARSAEHFLTAAQNAARVFAHQDAAALASRGLEVLGLLPDTPERVPTELRLQMTLGLQLQITDGFAAPEAERAYARARDLSRRVPDAPPLFSVLWGLWLFYKVRSELPKARAMAEELLALARNVRDSALVLQAQQALAVTTLCLGEPTATRGHMEQGTALYDPRQHHGHTFLYGQDPGVACLAFGAVALWLLGHADQAAKKCREAISLGRELSQPSTQALALHFAAMLHQCRRDPRATQDFAEAALAISAEQGLAFWLAGGTVLRGWAMAAQGARAEGTALLRQGLGAWLATGSVTYQTYYLGLLAETLGESGEAPEGLSALADALDLVRSTGEHLYEAELHRLQGELLLRSAAGGPLPGEEAEACFRQALAVARRQGAKSFELRAAMSLARLFQRQGRASEAFPQLAEVLGWFTEGLDTPDLRDANRLIGALQR
jgi:predicted ATPase/tRNA A-37 threonylcarbamoyl transferase component Bud32